MNPHLPWRHARGRLARGLVAGCAATLPLLAQAADNPSAPARSAPLGSAPTIGPATAPATPSAADRRLATTVREALAADPQVELSEIDVQVNAGVVTLSGLVNTPAEAQRARDIVRALAGVLLLRDQLVVTHTPDGTDDSTIRRSLNDA
ncbi:MAG: BON domain-containing protein [Rhodocyclaceae bacterium]|nr:BON domain-containing protein [Rhodocyclaceae bacterium]